MLTSFSEEVMVETLEQPRKLVLEQISLYQEQL